MIFSLLPKSLPGSLTGTLFLAISAMAFCQDLPPPQNPDELLRELDKIGKGNESRAQQRRADAISRIQSAAASPGSSLDLYLQALNETKYRNQPQEFFKWKQEHQEDINHASFRNAAHLQMCYLLLALKRSDHSLSVRA